MGHIRKEELHESLINELEELGNIDLSGKQDKTDESLLTESKDLVGAINELFQSANNGKQLIANAIGDDLEANDTFVVIANKIDAMLLKFRDAIEQYGSNPLVTDAKLNAMIDSAIEIFETIGELSDLETDNKSSIVDAINELLDDFEKILAEREQDRQKLLEILKESGMELTGKESFEELIDKIDINDGVIVRNCGIKQIACGNNNSFILKNDGSLWACGRNNNGQFGLGDDTDHKSTFIYISKNVKQIACGHNHTFIIKDDGTMWSCGYNGNGQLGLGDTTDRNIFTQVTANINNDVVQIACGEQHTLILKNDGSLWACGYNGNGQLGLGDTDNRNTFTKVINNVDNDIKFVTCGYQHTVIIKTDDSVWSCGNNQRGQLGLGDTTNRTVFTEITNNAKQIDSTYQTTFIVKNDGSLWSCGYNYHGELGLGSSGIENYTATLTQVTTNINNDVKHVACGGGYGHQFTLIIKNDGSLWGCGNGGGGSLGLGHTGSPNTFTQVTTNINNDVVQIACGGTQYTGHTFILKTDGSVWATGNVTCGQLGIGVIGKTTLSFGKSFLYSMIKNINERSVDINE